MEDKILFVKWFLQPDHSKITGPLTTSTSKPPYERFGSRYLFICYHLASNRPPLVMSPRFQCTFVPFSRAASHVLIVMKDCMSDNLLVYHPRSLLCYWSHQMLTRHMLDDASVLRTYALHTSSVGRSIAQTHIRCANFRYQNAV